MGKLGTGRVGKRLKDLGAELDDDVELRAAAAGRTAVADEALFTLDGKGSGAVATAAVSGRKRPRSEMEASSASAAAAASAASAAAVSAVASKAKVYVRKAKAAPPARTGEVALLKKAERALAAGQVADLPSVAGPAAPAASFKTASRAAKRAATAEAAAAALRDADRFARPVAPVTQPHVLALPFRIAREGHMQPPKEEPVMDDAGRTGEVAKAGPDATAALAAGAVSYNPSVEAHQAALVAAAEAAAALEEREAAKTAHQALKRRKISAHEVADDDEEEEEEEGSEGEGEEEAAGASTAAAAGGASADADAGAAASGRVFRLSRRDRMRVARGRKPHLSVAAPSKAERAAAAAKVAAEAATLATAPTVDAAVAAADASAAATAVRRRNVSRAPSTGADGTGAAAPTIAGKPKQRKAPAVARGASGNLPLMVPLSEELAGSLRGLKPVAAGALAAESLASAIGAGLLMEKRRVAKAGAGKSGGTARYKEYIQRRGPSGPYDGPGSLAGEDGGRKGKGKGGY